MTKYGVNFFPIPIGIFRIGPGTGRLVRLGLGKLMMGQKSALIKSELMQCTNMGIWLGWMMELGQIGNAKSKESNPSSIRISAKI
jgi:hypothetical protein